VQLAAIAPSRFWPKRQFAVTQQFGLSERSRQTGTCHLDRVGRRWPRADKRRREIPQCSSLLPCYPLDEPGAAQHDSEQFRSTPRTCGRFRGILSMR